MYLVSYSFLMRMQAHASFIAVQIVVMLVFWQKPWQAFCLPKEIKVELIITINSKIYVTLAGFYISPCSLPRGVRSAACCAVRTEMD